MIGALNMDGQSASGYTVHGSLPVLGETRIVEDALLVNARYALSFQRVQISKRLHRKQYAIFWDKKYIVTIAKTLASFRYPIRCLERCDELGCRSSSDIWVPHL